MMIRTLLLVFLVPVTVYSQNIEVQHFRNNSSSSLEAYWVEKNIPETLNPYLWLDASKDIYFEDNSGDQISCNSTNTHQVKKWLDRSGNNRHFEAVSDNASPIYHCDSQTDPYYLFDSKVTADGIDDDMRFDFSSAAAGTLDGLSGVIDQDFTFVFVLEAINPNPLNYNSFIASGNSPYIAKNWQISTTNDINNFYFLLRGDDPSNSKEKQIIPYDTDPHVFIIQRYTVGNTIRIKFLADGNLAFDESVNSASAPSLSLIKLYKNRNDGRYLNSNFKEFFVFNEELTSDQQFELEQYLLAKWGVNK